MARIQLPSLMRTLESTRQALAPRSPSPVTVVGPELAHNRFIGAAAALPPLVLVVDDHEDSRDDRAAGARERGLPRCGSEDRMRGDPRSRCAAPVAVLLDLVLPELDGWEVARRLRENDATSAAAIIALTAAVLPSDHERARLAGCDMVLTKPVLPSGIVRTLCRAHRRCQSPAGNALRLTLGESGGGQPPVTSAAALVVSASAFKRSNIRTRSGERSAPASWSSRARDAP